MMLMGLRRLHFIGIGGTGMSPLAEVFAGSGYKVSGSDLISNDATERLVRLGVRVYRGHRRSNLGRAEAVIFSPAVAADNPEVKAARAKGVPLVPRMVLLDQLMRGRYGIGVAGTHGKTTVASMIASVLTAARLEPTVVLGGVLPGSKSGARIGRGKYVVAEACEYKSSFLQLNPAVAVVTNIEPEHMEYFRTPRRLLEVFEKYIRKVPFYGCAVLSMDDPVLRRLVRRGLGVPFRGYAVDRDADYACREIELAASQSSFTVLRDGKKMGRVCLNVPGGHNVSNALAAVAVALELGVKLLVIARTLARFENVKRRFDLRKVAGVTLLDDYAHHPTEVKATLLAARRACRGRLRVIFQPHLYSRTRLLADDFVRSLALADEVVVTDVFKSREKDRLRISGDMLVKKARRIISKRLAARFQYIGDLKLAGEHFRRSVADGDWLVTMGAGDVWQVRDELLEKLSNRA